METVKDTQNDGGVIVEGTVYDIIFQNFRTFNRVLAYNHSKICRVEVYTNGSCGKIVEKSFQTFCRFRTCFNSEICAHFIAVFGNSLFNKRGRFQRNGAEDNALYSVSEIKFDILHCANPAANFNLKRCVCGNGKEYIAVYSFFFQRAVQIHHMYPLCAVLNKAFCGFERICGNLRSGGKFALIKANGLAAHNIDSG